MLESILAPKGEKQDMFSLLQQEVAMAQETAGVDDDDGGARERQNTVNLDFTLDDMFAVK